MYDIEIQNLYKIYKNGHLAVDDFSISIERSTSLALLGPNGAGKSTIINILAGLVKKTSGRILITGIDMDIDPVSVKNKIGVVPQDVSLDVFFCVKEYLELYAGYFGIKISKKRLEELLFNLGLQDKSNENTRSLSGGMKRRLMIAKAMIHSPRILILDEPTAGVDIELRSRILNYTKELNKQGTTIILTTHNLTEVEEISDKIAFISKSKLVAFDKKAYFLESMTDKYIDVVFASSVPEEYLLKITGYEPLSQVEGRASIKIPYENYMNETISQILALNINIVSINYRKESINDIFKKMI